MYHLLKQTRLLILFRIVLSNDAMKRKRKDNLPREILFIKCNECYFSNKNLFMIVIIFRSLRDFPLSIRNILSISFLKIN